MIDSQCLKTTYKLFYSVFYPGFKYIYTHLRDGFSTFFSTFFSTNVIYIQGKKCIYKNKEILTKKLDIDGEITAYMLTSPILDRTIHLYNYGFEYDFWGQEVTVQELIGCENHDILCIKYKGEEYFYTPDEVIDVSFIVKEGSGKLP
jgi:hypothetical protein